MTDEQNQPQPNTKRLGGRRFKKRETYARRQRILRYLNKFGWWSFDAEIWAKEEGVNRSTIYDDYEWLKANCKISTFDIEDMKAEVPQRLKALLAQASRSAHSAETHAERQKWTDTYTKLLKGATDFFEHFDMKNAHQQSVKLEVSESEAMARLEASLARDGIKDPRKYIVTAFAGDPMNVESLILEDDEDGGEDQDEQGNDRDDDSSGESEQT